MCVCVGGGGGGGGGLSFPNNENYEGSLFSKLRQLRHLNIPLNLA